MKTWKKAILTIGVASCLTGAVLTTIGYKTGGLEQLASSQAQKSKEHFVKKELDSFDQIDIDSSVYNVVIGEANIKKPFISYATHKKLKIDYKVENGKLIVRENSALTSPKNGIHFFTLKDLINVIQTGVVTDDKTMVISVPKGTNLRALKTTLRAGDLSLRNIRSKKTDIKLSAGDLDTQDSALTSGKITITAGDAQFNNSNLTGLITSVSAGDLDYDTGTSQNSSFKLSMGDFTANDLAFKENNQITTSSGDISITLASKNLTVLSNHSSEDVDITNQLKPSSTNKLTLKNNLGDVSVQ